MSEMSQSHDFYKVVEGADGAPIFDAKMSQVLLRDKISKLQNIRLEVRCIYITLCRVSIDTTKGESCLKTCLISTTFLTL